MLRRNKFWRRFLFQEDPKVRNLALGTTINSGRCGTLGQKNISRKISVPSP
jgi:hypothetical protein